MTASAPSLEGRLIGRLAAILGGSFLLFAVTYLFAIRNDAHYHAAEEVGEQARGLADTLRIGPSGTPVFGPAARHMVSRRMAIAAIDLDTSRIAAGSDPDLAASLAAIARDTLATATTIARPDGLVIIATERADFHDAHFRIGVRETMTGLRVALIGLTHEFAEEIFPCFLPALLLAIGVTWVTIRQSLRPLRRAAGDAQAISAAHPGRRIDGRGLTVELRPLIKAANLGLERLEAALDVQRRFTANAAHELRTPLAVMRARIDALPGGEERLALARDSDRIARALDQMLQVARLQADVQDQARPVDLASLARFVLADLAPLAHAQGRDLALEIEGAQRPTAPVAAGYDDARQDDAGPAATGLEGAIRNLVENALRFCPQGGTVTVRVGPGALLAVEDHGPGVPDADKPFIFEPFWRPTGEHGPGAGLGLAIVREVAALHGGAVTVEDIEGGGARFVLRLGQQPAAFETSVRLPSS